MTDVADNPGRTDTSPIRALYPEMPGRAAIVTGAARGMGAQFAKGLASRGVHVVGGDIDDVAMEATAEQLTKEIGEGSLAETPGRIVAAQIDVTVSAGHEALAQRALTEFGRIDYWVNNAGIFPFAHFADITEEQISATLDVNVKGVTYGAQAAARHMSEGGAIVNMSSVSAVRVRRGRAAYCTSKAAVHHLTECMAVELGDQGIRVNMIAPGFIDTEMTDWIKSDQPALETALANIPLHRFGSPEEVLGALLFLLSDAARYVTGNSIAVDGGSRHV